MNSMDDTRRFDIVRKENEKAMFWLEAVADLGVAYYRLAFGDGQVAWASL